MAECPKEALRDTTLPTAARLVLVALWHRAGREKRFVWPSRDTLASDVGSNERTLRRNLAILRERGWIREHVGDETVGNPGWYLCDPPGVPQVLGIDAPLGAHDRAAMNDHGVATNDQKSATNDRPLATERPRMTAEPATDGRSYSIGTNQEPTSRCKVGGSTVQQSAETPALAAAAARADAIGWKADFAYRWGQRFSGSGGRAMVPSPVNGASRLRALQEALDEFGGEVVTEVLLHVGDAVQRRTEASGDERVGMHPGRLASAFRPEAGTFAVLLDEWQRETRQKRVSGRAPVAPAELDGEPLTDEEQRVWMRAGGDDPEGAVRRARVEAAEMADLFGGVALAVTT